jgi:hypothetical protein
LQHDLDAAIELIFEDVVAVRGFIQAQVVGDDERGVDLAAFENCFVSFLAQKNNKFCQYSDLFCHIY